MRAPQRPANGRSGQQKRPSANGKSKSDKGGFDGDNIGMTQERQREIQASLFKMLGQADDPTLDDKDDTIQEPTPKQSAAPAKQSSKREVLATGVPVSAPTSKREVITTVPSDEAV